jgi:hypothetical protein
MNELPRQKLCEIILQYGRSLCNDPQRCEGLLRDLCGKHRPEISVLIAAQKEGIAATLLSSTQNVPKEILLAQLIQKLQDNLCMAEESARWAVESWALALGVISGSDITPVPLIYRQEKIFQPQLDKEFQNRTDTPPSPISMTGFLNETILKCTSKAILITSIIFILFSIACLGCSLYLFIFLRDSGGIPFVMLSILNGGLGFFSLQKSFDSLVLNFTGFTWQTLGKTFSFHWSNLESFEVYNNTFGVPIGVGFRFRPNYQGTIYPLTKWLRKAGSRYDFFIPAYFGRMKPQELAELLNEWKRRTGHI